MLTCRDLAEGELHALLESFGLALIDVAMETSIPGSYWGEPEAGVVGTNVFVRADTPVHSALHEACHLIVKPAETRVSIHTDASDSIDEEDATCYLQILLADRLRGVGCARLMTDMDAWGYSFRLGSARAWFETDADNARDWLIARGLLESQGAVLFPPQPEEISPATATGSINSEP